ncbi:MAG: phosphoribosylanthranilate isomerase [Chloroflexota bacterium]|nr:phosphoribosylanthranilate isomerase [Chloroflexota bacterium]
MTRVKICGIKTMAQADAALGAGADYLGFIFYRPSHRYVEPALVGEIVAACRARYGDPDRWQAVGVFVDEPLEAVADTAESAGLDLVQLCGSEDRTFAERVGRPVVRVVHVERDGTFVGPPDPAVHGAARLLLDTKMDGRFGGTGTTYAWDAVRPVAASSFLAGGLRPDNVAAAVRAARPWAVDVSSGVERNKLKDPALIRQFIEEVRRVDAGDR